MPNTLRTHVFQAYFRVSFLKNLRDFELKSRLDYINERFHIIQREDGTS